jgi:hypothetical protein
MITARKSPAAVLVLNSVDDIHELRGLLASAIANWETELWSLGEQRRAYENFCQEDFGTELEELDKKIGDILIYRSHAQGIFNLL